MTGTLEIIQRGQTVTWDTEDPTSVDEARRKVNEVFEDHGRVQTKEGERLTPESFDPMVHTELQSLSAFAGG